MSVVTVVHDVPVDGAEPDEFGQIPTEPQVTVAPGCRHRPLTFDETAEYAVDIATQPWKTTVPLFEYSAELVAALLAMKPDARIDVDGQEYHVDGGIRPHPDLQGRPFKATIISTKQIG